MAAKTSVAIQAKTICLGLGCNFGFGLVAGKKKAHKQKLFCPVGLGTTPGLSRDFTGLCFWDKFGENLGQTRVFSLFYTVEARFHRACPWDKPGLSLEQSRGRTSAHDLSIFRAMPAST